MRYPIITIGREHGSGGRLIAKQLAADLNIPLYDKKLIDMIAKDSGFAEETIERAQEKKTGSFLYNLYFSMNNLPISDQIFIAQSKVIKKVASEGPCVIVGRCADYVLRDRKDVLNVFVYAPVKDRIHRVQEVYGEISENPEAYLKNCDKRRSSYYNFFTDLTWGDPHNHHLMINSNLGLEKAAKIIADIAQGEGR